ncbi:MAG: YrhA family protein [Oscillospiraceae bacterium]|nr:YrhA family protein [Oscillospiraceae bacterium]
MNNEIIDLLDKIKTKRNQNPFREFCYSSCTDQDIRKLCNWLKVRLGDSAPNLSGFIGFCQIADGFNSNGVFMFSINPDKDEFMNIYVKNEHWWEVMVEKKYLLIGNDDISWYALELSSGKYCILDLTCGDLVEEVDDFDTLLEIALSKAL